MNVFRFSISKNKTVPKIEPWATPQLTEQEILNRNCFYFVLKSFRLNLKWYKRFLVA